MIKTEKFYVKSDALKVSENIDRVRDLVISEVRNTEFAKVSRKKAFKDAREAIESAHVDVDALTCKETIVLEVLGAEKGASFLKDRAEYQALKKEVEACVPLDQITSLCQTDRTWVLLMAHIICPSVVLTKIFDEIDVATPVKNWYASGKGANKLKEVLQPIFHRLLGTEGDLFYGIKVRKSSFDDVDIRNFLAIFGGQAKRIETKEKDKDGKEIVKFSNHNWIDKSGNQKTQEAAFTTLLSVILDNPEKHVVLKPEPEKEEEVNAEEK